MMWSLYQIGWQGNMVGNSGNRWRPDNLCKEICFGVLCATSPLLFRGVTSLDSPDDTLHRAMLNENDREHSFA